MGGLLFLHFTVPISYACAAWLLCNVVIEAWRPCSTGVWLAASLQAISQPAVVWAGYEDGHVVGGGRLKTIVDMIDDDTHEWVPC